MSGGEVRDEEIADGPVVSGSGSAGSGGTIGARGAVRVLAMAGGQGYSPGSAAGVVNLVERLSLWMQVVDAGVDDIDEELLGRFLAAERSRDRPCVSVETWMGALRRFLTAAGYLKAAEVGCGAR
ncbi:MAG: hypothetical protein V9E82_07200 [Candidatus Nanopelagicales bacterium]